MRTRAGGQEMASPPEQKGVVECALPVIEDHVNHGRKEEWPVWWDARGDGTRI